MMLLAGLWHALKVVSAGLYWLLTLCLVWAGFALMGQAAVWGWADIFVAVGLFVARGLITPRFVSAGASYVAGFGAQIVYLLLAAVLTGYGAT